MNGRYETIDIEELPDGSLQGYNAVLGLFLRWTRRRLGWHDPATGEHIATFDSEQLRADREQARADREQASRLQAEARVRELEEQLHRLCGD